MHRAATHRLDLAVRRLLYLGSIARLMSSVCVFDALSDVDISPKKRCGEERVVPILSQPCRDRDASVERSSVFEFDEVFWIEEAEHGRQVRDVAGSLKPRVSWVAFVEQDGCFLHRVDGDVADEATNDDVEPPVRMEMARRRTWRKLGVDHDVSVSRVGSVRVFGCN